MEARVSPPAPRTPITIRSALYVSAVLSIASAVIAGHYHGKVFAVHVIPPEAYNFVLPPDSIPAVDKAVKEWTEQQMNTLLGCNQLEGVPHEGLIKHGEIWDGLAQCIEQHHIALIVAGTRGRRGFKKLIMGSGRGRDIPFVTSPGAYGPS